MLTVHAFAGPIPSSLLARQDLETAIVVLSDRLTPFRDRVTRIKGEGLARRQMGQVKAAICWKLS
jgi:hypothetical protein